MNAPVSHRLRLDIQGLRALAVLLVIFAHALDFPSGGFIGVDVFFVISGFVITGLLLREHQRRGRISLKTFYIKRAKRIAPAAVLVITVTTIAGFALFSLDQFRSLWKDAVASTLFFANWRMAATGTDYFQQGLPPSPLQHYWSLSVEEQFYLIWPLALILLFALAKTPRARVLAVGGFLAALIALGLAWSIYDTATNAAFAYFSSFTRFWELAVGAALACAAPLFRRLPDALRAILLYGGLALILVAAFVLKPESPFPGSLALLPVLGSAAVIAAGVDAPDRYDRLAWPLTNRIAQHLGDRSYSLYLWHFPLIVLAPEILPVTGPVLLGIIVLTWLLSTLTYRFVENPVRYSDWLTPGKSPSKRRIGAMEATAILTTGALTLALTFVGYQRIADAAEAAGTGTAESVATECLGAASLQTGARCEPSSTIVPALDGLQQDTGGAYSSECWRAENDAPKSCTFGSDSPSAKRVALIGDSQAAMYIPVLRELAGDFDWKVTTYVGWGCAWVPHPGQPCESQATLAQNALTAPGSYDLILTAASRKALKSLDAEGVRQSTELWRAAADSGASIVALESVPIPSEESLQCVQRVGFDVTNNDCATPLAAATAYPDAIAEIANGLPGAASVVSTIDLVCEADRCPSVVGNVVAYRDADGHLTASYLATMKPYLSERLRQAVSG